MSYIEKLAISGVRAFPVDHRETIAFGKPLTIVTGINGSGKTTIIEALKFACTGGLPPGASLKGAWVHDPGPFGDKHVMAQVKLMFRAANGTQLVATRSLALDIKKTTRTQKTAESSLLMKRHGQKTTLSTRVAEIDQQIPLYLGVSQSLLENVVFCHQEDSQWPLAESSALKKKFDEIFEAGKYTSAIKELLQIRKKHRADLGRQEEVASSAKKDRDRARKVDQQMKKLYADVESLRNTAVDLERRMDDAQQAANNYWLEGERFNETFLNLERYRDKANSAEQMLNDLKQRLVELPNSDEWLESALAQFDSNLSKLRDEKQDKTDEYHAQDQELKALKVQLDAKLTERGQAEQEKRTYEQQLGRRRAKVAESAAKHEIRGFNDLTDDARAEEFLYKIKKISKDKALKERKSRAEADNQKRDAQIRINQLTEREKVLRDNKNNANQQIALRNREAAQKQNDIDLIEANEGDKAAIESRIDANTAKLMTTQDGLDSTNYPGKIRGQEKELAGLKEELKVLNDDLYQGIAHATEVAQITHLRQELKEKQRGLKTLVSAHSGRIETLIGNSWAVDDLEARYSALAGDADRTLKAAEKTRDDSLGKAEQLQFRCKTARDDHAQKKAQAVEQSRIVQIAIEDDVSSYPDVLQVTEANLASAQDAAQSVGGLADYFQIALKTAESDRSCRLCERGFQTNGPGPAALDKFKKRLEDLVDRSAKEAAFEELEPAKKDYDQVALVKINYENWKRLDGEEIPDLEREVSKLRKEHEELLRQVEREDQDVQDAQSVCKDIESIHSITTSIVKAHQEVLHLEAKLARLATNQPQSADTRTPDEIQDQISNLNTRIRESEETLGRLKDSQNAAHSTLSATELEISRLRNELSVLSQKLTAKSVLVSEIERLKEENKKQRSLIEEINVELDNIRPEIETANAQYDDIVQRTEVDLSGLAEDAADLQRTVDALVLITDEIQSYEKNEGHKKLSGILADIERLRQTSVALEEIRLQLTRQINNLDEQLRDSEATRTRYADNLRYRQESRSLIWYREEIEKLQKENVEADRDELQRKSREKTKEHHNLSGQREGIVGELKSKDIQLRDLKADYDVDLKDAAIRYREAHVKVESTKAAIEDIGKYSTALDQAVSKYHALKLKEINDIIDELWRATYQGSDVDTIYIKSDLEVKANTRSHNYRVVMIKRDIEMDMRGRCSAGQKVLASIIIRLALAECFSKDCGVIALDEPTTNLDEQNVDALAVALHKIIEARQRQANFQLIVITHDAQFLQAMHCEDFIDEYWNISRNTKDESRIEKQDIGVVLRG